MSLNIAMLFSSCWISACPPKSPQIPINPSPPPPPVRLRTSPRRQLAPRAESVHFRSLHACSGSAKLYWWDRSTRLDASEGALPKCSPRWRARPCGPVCRPTNTNKECRGRPLPPM
eukprot:443505-Prorocentrum_minimum.AAC.1